MKTRIGNPSLPTPALVLALMFTLVGCGNSPTDPDQSSLANNRASRNGTAVTDPSSLVTGIQTAGLSQLQALAGCLPPNAGLPQPPVVPRNATLADIVALTPRIVAFRQAIVTYFQALPLSGVVRLTPCVVEALKIRDESQDTEEAGRAYEVIADLSVSQALAIADCLGSASGLPPAPELGPNPSLAEITRLTPALVAYRNRVVEYLSGLTLAEIIAMTPCLAKVGVPIT